MEYTSLVELLFLPRDICLNFFVHLSTTLQVPLDLKVFFQKLADEMKQTHNITFREKDTTNVKLIKRTRYKQENEKKTVYD